MRISFSSRILSRPAQIITSATRPIEPETMDEVAEPRIATQRVKVRIDVQKNQRSRMLAVLPLEVGKRFVTMSAEKRHPQTAVEVVVATRGTPLPFLERAICLFEAAGLLIGIGDVDEKVDAIRVELQSLLRRRDGIRMHPLRCIIPAENPVCERKVGIELQRMPALGDGLIVLTRVREDVCHVGVDDDGDRIRFLRFADLSDGLVESL